MKNRKPVQIITIVFALTMLTAYVVHSQLQQARSVAPGSKSMVLTPAGPVAVGKETNTVAQRQKVTVAPGSKSDVPLLAIDKTPAIKSNSAPSKPMMLFPGSKSAPVFDARGTENIIAPKFKLSVAPSAHSTNGASQTKP